MAKRIEIVIVDDNLELLESLELYFREKGYEVAIADNGEAGLALIQARKPAVAIVDLRLPGMSGLELLQALKVEGVDCRIIVITAYQEMETTVQAIKLGAFDYLHKPIDIDALDAVIDKALSDIPGTESIKVVDEGFKENTIVGRSHELKEIFKLIGLLSEVKTTVLIVGESGTGKELVARAIHYYSSSAGEPFIALNCSAIVENLIESELFGHEQGSFTGASETKKGKLEIAGGGTLFLDEISGIPLHLQAKLLRFIQEREFERVGGNQKIKFNARIIAATNRDLAQMVKRGEFREDLYFRLKVFEISIPPLRKRKEDIPLKSLSEIEAQHIAHVLECCYGNISRAARILGITRPTLRNKIKSFKLSSGDG